MIESSTLMDQVTEIINGPKTDASFTYEVRVQRPDGVSVEPLKMVSKDLVRAYNTAYADKIVIELLFSVGTYLTQVYPYKDNLKIIVNRIPIGETADGEVISEGIDSQTFQAILLDPRDHRKEAKDRRLDDPTLADLSDMVLVNFQLIETNAAYLRSVQVGGLFKNLTPETVLRIILNEELKKIPVDQGVDIKTVNFVEGDNKTPRPHVVIPHGMPLTKFPSFLQDECGGIYNSEIGFYLQQGSWYVWPLFNTERFERSPEGLTVLNLPEGRFNGVERTYKQTNRQLIVICTGASRSIDTASSRQLGEGNVVQFIDSVKSFDSPVETLANKALLSAAKAVTQVAYSAAKTGFNHFGDAVRKKSSNPYSEFSKVASRQGQVIQIVWENSNPKLLFPGMPLRYYYDNNGKTHEYHGVLLGCHSYTRIAGTGVTARRYTTQTTLYIFIKEDDLGVA